MILHWLRWSVLLLLILLSALILKWLYENTERYQQLENTGLSTQARRNPFLAAEFFLQRTGIRVESVSGRTILDQLPSTGDSIILTDANIVLSQKRQQNLYEWLQQGGHLLTTIPKSGDDGSVVENMFTIKGVVNEIQDQNKNNDSEKKADTLMVISFRGSDETMQVSVNPRYSLRYDAEFYHDSATEIDVDGNVHLIQLSIGEGFITVLSDLDFLKNDHINEFDHAWFIWNMVSGDGKVWIMYSNQVPPLWVKAWQYNSALFISFSILAGLIFWSLWNRFGPILQEEGLYRRNILEHLNAVGMYHWKVDKAGQLLKQNRRLVRQRVESRHPAWKHMSDREQMEWLAHRIDMALPALWEAFRATPESDAELVHITRLLQKVRNST